LQDSVKLIEILNKYFLQSFVPKHKMVKKK